QIASVIVDRRVGDEDVIFLAPLVRPETQSLRGLDAHRLLLVAAQVGVEAPLVRPATQSLRGLDAHLRRYKEEPVESFRNFRDALRVARLPRLLRRLFWWLSLHVLPSRRARHFGTFGVTTMSPFGARTLEVPTLWTAFLHYGVVTEAG